MFKKIEALGDSLLALIAPKTEAAAAACYVRYYSACWQCAGRPCEACCDSSGKNCQYIDCR